MKNAKLLITSQSTSKAFKAISGRAATSVITRARVSRGGLLFLVPQPMQCFGGSILSQSTHVVLEGSAEMKDNRKDEDFDGQGKEHGDDRPSLLLVDWYTGGRENLDGGLWQLSSFHTKTTVSYSSQPLFPEEDDSIDGDEYSLGQGQQNKTDNDISDEDRQKEKSILVFRDSTRLSGGDELKRHMRDYNVVCMVILIGPKVEYVASTFMKKYSSRHTYAYDDDDNEGGENNGDKDNLPSFGKNTSKNMDYNRGEGLNRSDEGLIVSCGKFSTCKEGDYQEGVVVRLAASSLETAGACIGSAILMNFQ